MKQRRRWQKIAPFGFLILILLIGSGMARGDESRLSSTLVSKDQVERSVASLGIPPQQPLLMRIGATVFDSGNPAHQSLKKKGAGRTIVERSRAAYEQRLRQVGPVIRLISGDGRWQNPTSGFMESEPSYYSEVQMVPEALPALFETLVRFFGVQNQQEMMVWVCKPRLEKQGTGRIMLTVVFPPGRSGPKDQEMIARSLLAAGISGWTRAEVQGRTMLYAVTPARLRRDALNLILRLQKGLADFHPRLRIDDVWEFRLSRDASGAYKLNVEGQEP